MIRNQWTVVFLVNPLRITNITILISKTNIYTLKSGSGKTRSNGVQVLSAYLHFPKAFVDTLPQSNVFLICN